MAVGLTLMAMDVLGLFPGSVLVHNAVVSVMNDAVMPVRLQTSYASRALLVHCRLFPLLAPVPSPH
jgi:hypothetical protein